VEEETRSVSTEGMLDIAMKLASNKIVALVVTGFPENPKKGPRGRHKESIKRQNTVAVTTALRRCEHAMDLGC
jgi:hypothetical protein